MKNNSLTKKLIKRYMLTVIGFIALVFIIFIIGAAVCSLKIWYPDDPDYIILKSIKTHKWLIGGFLCFITWFIVTISFLVKWTRYINEILNASKKLTTQAEQPIILSEDLKSIQDELNAVRENAVHNSMLAKEAEQRKNDLIVYLAHDLKTPLTSVIGYLTLLEDEPDIPQKTREKYTSIALNKAERLEDLINEFFDITRFNLTNIELDIEKVNLSRMLEQICSEFIPILLEHKLSWNLDIAPDINLMCDPDKLSRVFDNLIRNAVNYSYPDTEITCVLTKQDKNIHILFKNHGKTISPEKLSRVFEQFFRLDSSRASSTGGAGLGLAIAKEIVELHGGQINAASENESISFEVVFRNDL